MYWFTRVNRTYRFIKVKRTYMFTWINMEQGFTNPYKGFQNTDNKGGN